MYTPHMETPRLFRLFAQGNHRPGKIWLWFLIAVVALSLAACSAAASESGVDEVGIYSAVIRRIYTQDDTFGGSLNPPTVYVVNTTNDSIGDPDVEQAKPRLISPAAQEGIVEALSDLPAKFIWVDDASAVPVEADTGAVTGDGVIVTLGNIHEQDDDSVLVSGSIFIASLAAGGQTYVLEQVNGGWQVTGTTGVQWMS